MAQGGRVLGMAVVLAVAPIAQRSPFRRAAAASWVGCHLPAFCATSGAQSQIGQAGHTPYHASKCRVSENAEQGRLTSSNPGQFPCSYLFDSAFSEALQKGQELVTGLVAARLAFERIRFRQRLLFEREIGMEIDLSSFHGFMAQP